MSAMFGLFMLLPVAVSLYYHSAHTFQFAACGSAVLFFGLLCRLVIGVKPTHLTRRDGFIIVALVWVLFSILGALPFWVIGINQSFVDSLFESVSGLTTTGATILSQLDTQPHAILFWRSILQWLGGMGIIVLAIAIIPFLGAGGMQLFLAEVPGPNKDKLTARINHTAASLWLLYLLLTLACALAYWLAGMTAFDALNHAMCTLSTGGFSTHDASFAYYGQVPLHWIAILFMLVGGINFALHFSVLHGHGLRSYHDDECRWLFLWLLLLFIALWVSGADAASSWDEVLFTLVSIATTTGFVTVDYSLWPPAATLVIAIAMYVGASAGSTSGGMKVIRLLLLIKYGYLQLRQLIHPHAVLRIRVNRLHADNTVIQAILAFAILYTASIAMLTFFVSLTGVDVATAYSAALTCISNTGPGFGAVGPASNFEHLADSVKYMLVLGMIAGRLELFTMLVLLMPDFWRK